MKKYLYLIAFVLFGYCGFSQSAKSQIAKGNSEFESKKFEEAETAYRIANSKGENVRGSYNLGNAIYRMKQPAEAGFAYFRSVENAKTRPEKHKAFHNLGNVFMNMKDYGKAVEAYKNALINNPTDEKTRYNYALAKELLKKNPPKNNDKDKDKDKKEKNKEKNKPDQNKKDDKNKDQKQDQQGNDPKKNDNKNPGKQNPGKAGISKDRMQNLLDAVNNEEKKIQDKVNKNKVKGKPVQSEKDW